MRSRLAAVCLTVGLLAVPSARTVAVSHIPVEAGPAQLLGAQSAIVGDVDADGVRELISLRRWQNDPGRLAVEVSQVLGNGFLIPRGQVLLRRHASPEDVITGGARPDDDGMLVVGAAEPARLLAWHVDGVERVIVAGVGTEGLVRPSGPTLWEVGLDESGFTELRFLYDSQAAGSSIYAVDLDGDETDELVIAEPPDQVQPDSVQIRVLTWDGGTFMKVSRYLTPGQTSDLVPLGDSDGRPGEELGMIGVPSEGPVPALLHRISLDDDGALRTEVGGLPFVGELAALQGSEGGRIVLASPAEGLRLFDWPADGVLAEMGTSPQRGFPLGVVGSGGNVRLLLRDQGIVRVLDEGLVEQSVIEPTAAAGRFRNLAFAPFEGLLPGGLADAREAVIVGGQLVSAGSGTESPDGDPLSQRAVAALPGISPIGVLGPEGAWMALATSTRFDAARNGGRMIADAPIEPIGVRAAAIADVLRPEVDGGALEPAVIGAITDPRPAGSPILLARDAFDVEFTGPPGSSVTLENSNPEDLLQVEMGASGTVRLTIEPPSAAAVGDEAFSARLQVVTPAGHGYIARWEVQIHREPPPVAAGTPVAPLSFSVPVRGRTEPGATVVVDGVPAVVQADGSFEAEVQAGPIPRDVRIQVTDRVGNSAQHTLSVVGLVDFRRLPWIPVVALLTVLAGVVLFLRVPRPRRPVARSAGDDATFEEIN